MNINRNNYEEFFLLHVDNELDAQERVAVENFAKQNPDLAKELEMLQQATLCDDSLPFDQKELLFKKENTISPDSYQEYFLLSVDNELDEQQQNDVEKFVLQRPQLQDEFTTLQQTKLEPEIVVFEGKEILYRKEKVRRIIPLTWMKWSVAAAVAGLVAFTWFTTLNNNFNSRTTASNIEVKKPSAKLPSSIIEKPVTEQPVASLQKEKNNKKVIRKATTAKKIIAEKKVNAEKTVLERNAVAVTAQQPKIQKESVVSDNSLARKERPAINPKSANTPNVAFKNNTTNGSNVINTNDANKTSLVNHKEIAQEPTLASNALYREIDTDDEEKVLYVGGARINKNKLKGLFKKAASFLDKKIGRNDDEKALHIASFEIKSN